MKRIILILLLIGLGSCSSQKKIETSNQYFETGKSSIQEWVGGREESGSGFKLEISLTASTEGVSFEEIFFRQRILSCELKEEGSDFYLLAAYEHKALKNVNKDKDQLQTEDKFPFELLPTEAVIGYKKGSSPMKYLKITGIKEKAPLLFLSKPQN